MTDTAQGAAKEEVVTQSLVRYVDLPDKAGKAALITLDNGRDHTRPSTFGPGGLASLNAALDEIDARDDLVAVAVTGKPFIFAVGADLNTLVTDPSHDAVRAVGRLGHDTFRRLGEMSIPTFAFINGAAMGGGLELPLHCTYRTVSAGAAAVSLPECFLGLVPGWGGAWLLPHLIGPDNAVTVIIDNPLATNRQLKPKQVLQLGIADAMFEPADFLEQSLRWAAGVINGTIEPTRPEVDRSQAAWDAAVARGRAAVEAKYHGAAPGPVRALDLIEAARTASKDEGFAAEDLALADLVTGNELRAGLYAFDLVQKRAKRPVGAPDKSLARPVTKVGVVGAGLMAGQLALLFARRLLVPVVLTDVDQERLDRGVAEVHAQIDGLAAKGRVNGDLANRLKALVTGSLDKAAFADADFVVEAVFEEMKVKQQVFAELEAVVSPTCVLATNTSSLSVSQMAENLQHPERVVGFHFFNPVAILPLLEVVRGEATDDAALATAFAVGKQLKKSTVLVKDAPAFVVNRLLTRFLGTVMAAADRGTPIETADHALDPLGLPMSPFNLLALVGPAVALHVGRTMHEEFPDRFGVSDGLAAMVSAGKTAVYDWSSGSPVVDPEVAAMFSGDSPMTADEVRAEAERSLAEEIRLMLDEGVVAEPQDIDLCMLLGAGWPFHLGGITPYLDRSGVSEAVNGKRFLPPNVATAG
jgi:3-hydroxyacyl-CoA dehydrogenase/enoyl-CoA hydratase/carnithine racemase